MMCKVMILIQHCAYLPLFFLPMSRAIENLLILFMDGDLMATKQHIPFASETHQRQQVLVTSNEHTFMAFQEYCKIPHINGNFSKMWFISRIADIFHCSKKIS